MTATLGRQGLGVPKDKLQQMGLNVSGYGDFCDQFVIDNFGASAVESFDYSDFEGATHIADLNLPISGFDGRYNTIVDFGTMEHVFNAPQGLHNALTMCAVG